MKNILKKIITLVLAADLMLTGTEICVPQAASVRAAETEALTDVTCTNGGNITLSDPAFASETVTISGSCSGGAVRITGLLRTITPDEAIVGIAEQTAAADGSFTLSFGIKPQYNGASFRAEVKAAPETEKASVTFVLQSEALELSGALKELDSFFARCDEQKIPTDYERVKYATAKQVLSLLPTFRQNGEDEAYTFNAQEAARLCTEAKESLSSYLAGTATPKETVRTVTDRAGVEGQSFIANTTAGERPVFYVGYGHWQNTDMESFSDLGVNCIQYEIGPKNLLKRAAPVTDWELDDHSANMSQPVDYTINQVTDGTTAVNINATGSGEVYLSQTVEVEPKTDYTFGVRFRCDKTGSLFLAAYESNPAAERKDALKNRKYQNMNPGVGKWAEVSIPVTTGENQTSLDITVGTHSPESNLAYTGAYLKKSGTDTNLLKNPDFAQGNSEILSVNRTALTRLKEVFRRAEEANVSVMLLAAGHYFPEYLYSYDPTVKNQDSSVSHTNFMPFNPTHPLALSTMKQFMTVLTGAVKDSPALHSICLANEPAFYACQSDYYLEQYQDYLKQKYTTIDALNTAYRTDYTGFDRIAMPATTYKYSPADKNVPGFYDYVNFNQSIMTVYHKALADSVREVDASIPLHTKQMWNFEAQAYGPNRALGGMDPEDLAGFLELNGCDDAAYYGDSKATLMAKEMWYDYLTSIKDAPVVNTEDHILKDNKTLTRSDAERQFNMADIWQGALHGRGGTVLWLRDTSDRTKAGTNYYNANLTRRADYVAEIGRVALDLNRLAPEITAIQKEKPRVGILFSEATMLQQIYHINAAYIAYQSAITNGEKVRFVNETSPETDLAGLKLLVVPCANYMKASTMQAIADFAKNGGKVLLLDAGNKNWTDETGKAFTGEAAQALTDLKNNGTAVSFSGNANMAVTGTAAVQQAIQTAIAKLSRPVEVTAAGGTVEWESAKTERGLILSLCNQSDTAASVTLNGASYDTGGAIDLISGAAVGSSITLAPWQPMLLRIESLGDFTFYRKNQDGSRTEITQPVSGDLVASLKWKGAVSEKTYEHLTAVYQDGVLSYIYRNPATADKNGQLTSEIPFTIAAETNLDKCTVKTFLFDGLNIIRPCLPEKQLGITK